MNVALLASLCTSMGPSLSTPAWGAPTASGPSSSAPAPAPAEPVAVPAPAGPDRSGPPPLAESVLLDLPEPQVIELGPGVQALYVRAPGVRKLSVDVVLRRGMVDLDHLPTQVGRSTGALADVAAGTLTGAALSSEEDLVEAELYSAARLHEVEVSLEVPIDDPAGLARAFELQRLVLREPAFPKKDLKRWVTDQQLYYTVNGPASQAQLASSTLAFAWFPADHPYGVRPDLSQLAAVKSKTLQAHWAGWLRGSPITVLVVGDVDWAAVEAPIRKLVDGIGAAGPVGPAVPITPPSATRIVAVDLPGQEQVAIRMRTAAPTRDDPDAAAMSAVNFILGGQFLSRLNRNLREDKGYTYGAGSSYTWGRTDGALTVAVDVKTVNLAESLREIERELGRLCTEPVTADELDAAVRGYNVDWNRTFETATQAASAYRRGLSNELDIGQMHDRVAAVKAVDPERARATADKWFGEDAPKLWVLVGDRKTIEPELAELGWSPEWIDPRDAILGKF